MKQQQGKPGGWPKSPLWEHIGLGGKQACLNQSINCELVLAASPFTLLCNEGDGVGGGVFLGSGWGFSQG